MKLSDKQFEFVQDSAKLINFCVENDVKITFGEAHRTQFQQDEYLRTKKSKAKHSFHQDRLALDLNFFIQDKLTYEKDDLQFIGDYWESLNPNNRWGGNFKSLIDTPHFERLP